MSTFERFEDIEAWRQARVLCAEIYGVSGKGAFAKDVALRDQIRRSSVSIAKGSAGEVRSQLYIALDQGYVERDSCKQLVGLAADTARMIAGFMKYLRKSGVKGTKYKTYHT